MRWHRIRYTATTRTGEPVAGHVDVLGDQWNDPDTSYATWRAIRTKHTLDLLKPITIAYAGQSNGSAAVNHDPRDEDPPTTFHIRVA